MNKAIYIFDMDKKINFMFEHAEFKKEDWCSPYKCYLLLKEEYWEYFKNENQKKILKIESSQPELESGYYQYSCVPQEPGKIKLYSLSWFEEDYKKHLQPENKDNIKTNNIFSFFNKIMGGNSK